METAVVFMIGAAALASVVAYIVKSVQKKGACNCSSKSCSAGNPDCSR